jgi:hypothetical protein
MQHLHRMHRMMLDARRGRLPPLAGNMPIDDPLTASAASRAAA